MSFPTPESLGLPFPEWRAAQPDAIRFLTRSESKYTGLLAPVGFGKSAVAVGHALMSQARTCIITSTIPLAAQYLEDFGATLLDIKGQDHYDCEIELSTVRDAPCHTGYKCELRRNGCGFFDLKRTAREAPIVLTNYQFWMHSLEEKLGLGHFAQVIFDEAHQTVNELSKFLCTRITRREFREYLSQGPTKTWTEWAGDESLHLTSRLISLRKSKMSRAEKHRHVAAIRNLKRKLNRLSRATPENWVVQPGGYSGEYQWDCIHPGRYSRRHLFKRADRFILMSASLRPDTFSKLYIGASKASIQEFPSTFAVARRPIYYLPTIAWSAESTETEIRYLISVIDQFLAKRRDRKGIIHCVSYDRGLLIKSLSRFGADMLTHTPRDQAGIVAAFKQSPAPAILVSPSITEGHSFPYAQAEYCIIPKVPFPDTRGPVYAARSAHSKNHSMLDTCVTLHQMTGRGMRAEDDHCETLIPDRNFEWLHRGFRRLFPLDFNEAVRRVSYAPDPLPKLVK